LLAVRGRVAQLGERVVRNDEVAGSIPVTSTKIPNKTKAISTQGETPPLRFCPGAL
jgi:hypothetical protein